MIRLFTSYYIDKNPARAEEIRLCIEKNIACEAIDEIHLITEYPIEDEILKHPKIKRVLIHSRPSFDVLFFMVNSSAQAGDISIVANSDIYFDEGIKNVGDKIQSNECLALCRWDDTPQGITFLNRWDSQDTWIFKGQIRNANLFCDFTMGTAGCDNALAYRLYKVGYNVLNPSKTVKTYHLHNSKVTNYDPNNKVPQPYKLITPTE